MGSQVLLCTSSWCRLGTLFCKKEKPSREASYLPGPPHPRGLGRLRFIITSPSTHLSKDSHDRPREIERRTLRLKHQTSKIKGKFPLVFNLTNIVCRTGHLLSLILDQHLDRDIDKLNFSTHSNDGANEDASSRQRTMYDKSWGTDASVLSS